jgi:F0F1-type ATP synthase membrane subunit b/b'
MEKKGQTEDFLKYIFRIVILLLILWIFYQAVIKRIGSFG